MSDRKQRPGVMIYFDSIRPALKRLDNEQCGTLFRAVLDYSEYGEIPDLEPMTGMVFDLLRPKLDRDAERYEEGREQRQYATYCREAKKKGEQPHSFDRWKALSALKNVGSPSPTPFDPSTSPVPDADAVVVGDRVVVEDVDVDVDVVVDGYQPTSGNIGPISPERYKQPSEQEFERLRQEAQEKLFAAMNNN